MGKISQGFLFLFCLCFSVMEWILLSWHNLYRFMPLHEYQLGISLILRVQAFQCEITFMLRFIKLPRVSYNFQNISIQIQHEEGILLICQCFLCNLTCQICPIYCFSFYREKKISQNQFQNNNKKNKKPFSELILGKFVNIRKVSNRQSNWAL